VTPLLEVSDVRKRFGGLKAVDGVDLRVEAGELRAVIGPNGAGKSTLFNLVTGHFRPDTGTVTFDGADITGQPTYRIARAGIGRAFQITSIFPGLEVGENVRLGIVARRGESARPFGRAKGMHAAEVREILDAVGLLAVERARGGNLSHGDQRALELAISLALEPKLLLLDEPSEGLAPVVLGEIGRLLGGLKETGLAIVLAEQNHRFALRYADRAYLIEKGAIRHDAPAAEIVGSDALQRYLGV
jgi:branched-chain amino acid transport system ATP-binding protein